MRAIELLEEYAKLRKQIIRLDSQIDEIRERAESIRSWADGDKVQTWHDPDKIGRVIAKLSDMEDERNDLIIEAVDRMNDIEELLRELDNPDYSLVLQYKYIRGYTWEQTACRMYCTSRWAQILKGRALRAMDERMRHDSRFLE